MNAYKIRRYKELEDGTVEEYFDTVLAMTKREAMAEAMEGPAWMKTYNFEVIKIQKCETRSKVEVARDRCNHSVAYGDYEATGWMDE